MRLDQCPRGESRNLTRAERARWARGLGISEDDGLLQTMRGHFLSGTHIKELTDGQVRWLCGKWHAPEKG